MNWTKTKIHIIDEDWYYEHKFLGLFEINMSDGDIIGILDALDMERGL